MNERGQHEAVAVEEEPPEREVAVRAHESRPGRLVFTEDGNTDGWIATDLVLQPER
jgi:hypothetical protein